MKEMDPEDEQVQLQVRKLQDYITNHFYTCSDKILCGLGRMYAGGGELTENIDNVGGTGHCGVCKQSHGYILYEQEIRKNFARDNEEESMKAILYKAFLWQNEHTDICKNNKKYFWNNIVSIKYS